LETCAVDIIIAQGYEAGGHRGTFLGQSSNSASSSQPGTLALVAQIVDAVKVPVVAAGGIADGRGIAAAFALGAAGQPRFHTFLVGASVAARQRNAGSGAHAQIGAGSSRSIETAQRWLGRSFLLSLRPL
jgi:Nitronate monooxygenase